MEKSAELLSDEMADVFEWAFEEADESLSVVDPTPLVLGQVVDSLDAYGDGRPTVRLLARKSVLRSVMDDFLVAGRTADLVAADSLSLRVIDAETVEEPNVLSSATAVTSVVQTDDAFAGLRTDDVEFVAEVTEAHRTLFEESDEYGLRTPPLSRVESSLGAELGPDSRADFGAFLTNLQTARGDEDGPDEVAISLLVAARNREQFYELSRWAEDVGLASKATFSRKKTELEERGLLATEKVPGDVGRPRLRLVLADDRLSDASVAQLASVAQSTLA